MEAVGTLVEMLSRRTGDGPEETAFSFAGEDYGYGWLYEGSARVAAGLGDIGRGDRVVLVLPNGPDFFQAFYGVIRTGAAAVPLFHDSGPVRVAAIADHCDAVRVVLPDDMPDARFAAFRDALGARPASRVHQLAAEQPSTREVFPEPDDVAFFQYTSGSTGDPKGVMLTHRTLITNIRQMIAGMKLSREDVFVSWLPVYHDMGLILMTMAPFYLGARLVLLPTSLAKVKIWLKAIEEHRGTFTAAPDFAYRLCLRTIRDPGSIDLSTLRMALNAAEPVRADTVRGFHERFGHGDIIAPAYGLAEATVGVTTWPPATEIKVDDQGLVSVGKPFPEIELQIVDEAGEPVPCGTVGTIRVRSPANCKGYYLNPEAERALFPEPGVIDTGDLGYVDADGDLFIAGRKKNVIIAAGRTIAPQEIEETVDADPRIRMSAALGIDRGHVEGEQVYVFAEVRRPATLDETTLEDIEIDLVGALHDRLGFRPARVYLVKPKTIPRTPNGKTRHALLKQRYTTGALREENAILFPDY